MKIVYPIILGFLLSSCANLVQDPNTKFSNQAANDFSLPKYSSADLLDPIFKGKSAFIYTVLSNTVELNTHRMNGAIENQVFVHAEGREAVFDKNEKLVTSCENKGSFNYAHYKKSPLVHFTVDILPWLRWGNCREDNTSKQERIDAYMKDFDEGLSVSLESQTGYFLPVNFDFSQAGQSQAVAFFITSLESSGFNLHQFIISKQSDKNQRELFIEALKDGMLNHLDSV